MISKSVPSEVKDSEVTSIDKLSSPAAPPISSLSTTILFALSKPVPLSVTVTEVAVPLLFITTCITAFVPPCVAPPETVAPVLVPEAAVGTAIV